VWPFALKTELAAYFLGRFILAILVPWFDKEPPARRVWTEPRVWRWRGVAHRSGGTWLIHTEAIEIAGLLGIAGFVAGGVALR
jgi:hypothetical protein